MVFFKLFLPLSQIPRLEHSFGHAIFSIVCIICSIAISPKPWVVGTPVDGRKVDKLKVLSGNVTIVDNVDTCWLLISFCMTDVFRRISERQLSCMD